MILSKNCFSKHLNKIIFVLKLMSSRSRMTSKFLVVIFQALENYAASLTSAASATSLASLASTALFPQKTSWSWWFDHKWHQNNQYWFFFFWNGSSKIQIFIDIWYLFCWRLCYFFENWLMKLKFFNLRNIQIPSNKIYLHISNCQSKFTIYTLPWGTLQ